jgi:NADP-dependent 3-hydroxy acid dehydrogenase YdfG
MTAPAAPFYHPFMSTESPDPLSSRIAVISGASAGIGAAIARALASRGCRLILNARRQDRLAALARELDAPAGSVFTVPGDAAEQSVIDAMLDAAPARFNAHADAVIVNAGRGLAGSVATADPAQWEDLIRTNILGAARLMRSAAQRMVGTLEALPWQRHPRDIVVIGSIVGRHVSPFSSMYGSTKFAVHGLTEGLRRELAPKGIRVSLIEPGFVVSEFQGVAGYKPEWFEGVLDRIGPVLRPEDVANVVPFILSQPPHVHVADVIVRPTRQDYP